MARSRAGFTTGDLVIALAVLSLLAALIAPALRGRAFNALVEDATAEVEALSSSAQGVHRVMGSWPTAGGPGAIPSRVATAFPGASTFLREDYTLQWSLLDVVERVEAPPIPITEPVDPDDAPPDSATATFVPVARTLGSVMVHSGNESLLAELLARYGAASSYVRDTVWTLVVDTAR